MTRVQPGDHVTLSWKACCGDCYYCRHDQPAICDRHGAEINAGVMSDGTARMRWRGETLHQFGGLSTFAEYAVVREASVVPIRKDVPLDVAALVGCAVSTGVGAAMFTAKVRAGESVAVFGAGGVGLNIIQGAALCGAGPIIAVDKNSQKMEIAREFGATHCLMSDETVVAEIQKLTGGRGADHCLESVGIPGLQETAIAAVRPGGTVTLVGITPQDAGTTILGQVITCSERKILGSFYGSINPARDFRCFFGSVLCGQAQAGGAGDAALPAGRDQRGLREHADGRGRAGCDCVLSAGIMFVRLVRYCGTLHAFFYPIPRPLPQQAREGELNPADSIGICWISQGKLLVYVLFWYYISCLYV